jgi:predicted permease
VWVGTGTFELSKQWIHPNLALDDADRVVGIQFRSTESLDVVRGTLGDLAGWRSDLASVEQLSAFRMSQSNLITEESAGEPVQVAEVSPSAFEAARVPPHLGRFLIDSGARPDAPPVVVIGYDVWRQRFAAATDVIGRTVHVGRDPATVVGVMPEGFAFPVYHNVWIPMQTDVPGTGSGPRVWIFGRLADGVSLADAQAELSRLGQRAALDSPETHAHLNPEVVPYARSILTLEPNDFAAVRWVNVAVVLLVALVCANVALLIFARAATREGEIVVRSALGASRGRIVSQLFTEALVLGAVGTAVGLTASGYGLRFALFMLRENLGELPYWVNARLSPGSYFYAALLTVLGAAIAGVMPALRVTRDVARRLRQAGAGGGGLKFSGVWTAVIVAQVAVTVTFPVGALLIWRAGAPIQAYEVGFDESQFLSTELVLDVAGRDGAPADLSPAARRERFRSTVEELERRLSAEPAVAGVAFADRLPRMFHPEHPVEVAGAALLPRDSAFGPFVKAVAVDPDYLGVLGAPILAGRGFAPADAAAGQGVVIVNQSFVDQVLRGTNAVGQRVRFSQIRNPTSLEPEPGPWLEIVGVVRDVGTYHEGSQAALYRPLAVGSERVYAVVKTRGDPAAFAPRLREVAAAVDPTLRLDDLRALSDLGAGLVRFVSTLVRGALFVSAVALLLSLAAIYSVMSFAVSRRTREIGIRVALGANARPLLLAVFRRPLSQLTLGVGAGMLLVMLLVRAVGGSLSVRELGLVLAYAVLMTMVCMLACVVPTRRAMRVEPTEALREEA